MKTLIHLFALSLLFPALAVAEKSSPSIALPENVVGTFLKERCFRCHAEGSEESDHRLDALSLTISNNVTAQHWQDVLDTLNAGEMPPEEEPQPTNEELAKVLDVLTIGLRDARRQLSEQGKAITIRRLNRREYSNTIHHLFGFTLVPDELPEDDPVERYDTIGSQQYFSTYRWEKYLELGRRVVTDAFEWGNSGRKESKLQIDEQEVRINKHIRDGLSKRMTRWNEVVAGLEVGKTWKDLDFADGRELHYYLQFHAERSGGPRRYLEQEFIKTGVYVSHAPGAVFSTGIVRHGYDPRARYAIRLLAGVNKTPPESRKFVSVLADDVALPALKISGTPRDPHMIEFSHTPTFGRTHFQIQFREKRNMMIDGKNHKRQVDQYGEWCSIWVDRMEIEGPYYDKLTFFEQLLFPDGPPPRNQKIDRTDEEALEIIDQFAFEACRQMELTPEFLKKIHQMYQVSRQEGLDVEEALVDPLAVILSSPAFLYLSEKSHEEPGQTELSDRELAVRMAYFLWSGPPDEALLLVAENGNLKSPAILTSQIDRMLDDPRSQYLTDSFMSQWMQLKRFDAIAVSPEQFIHFDKSLAFSARREPAQFFRTLLDENLSLTNLINSDFIVIDQVLSHHYGMEGLTGQGFRKIKLPPDSKRGGLLGTTAFLTMGSTGDRTSPVIRGALAMEQLLNDPPASPPPNVPELKAAMIEPVSVREATLLHQTKPQCASCHAKMDAIGFGLENFDVIGQWRETEPVGDAEVAIDPSGTLPGEKHFSDLKELKSRLLDHQEQLAESLMEGMIAYGLGREVEFSDQKEVEKLVKQLKNDDYQARTLIHSFVQSELFRRK